MIHSKEYKIILKLLLLNDSFKINNNIKEWENSSDSSKNYYLAKIFQQKDEFYKEVNDYFDFLLEDVDKIKSKGEEYENS